MLTLAFDAGRLDYTWQLPMSPAVASLIPLPRESSAWLPADLDVILENCHLFLRRSLFLVAADVTWDDIRQLERQQRALLERQAADAWLVLEFCSRISVHLHSTDAPEIFHYLRTHGLFLQQTVRRVSRISRHQLSSRPGAGRQLIPSKTKQKTPDW